MRFAACLIVVLVCSGAFASDPGQPLDCSDMTFGVPGLTCSPLAPFGQPDSRWMGRASSMAVDNEGWVYVGFTRTEPDGVEIHRSRDGGQTVQVVARINERGSPVGWDRIRFSISAYAPAQSLEQILFDPTGGRLLLFFESRCQGNCPCGSFCSGTGYGGNWIASIEGFATTFEILQSFAPQAALGFHVPYMPEGFRAADSFDTYWGTLATVGDWSQAHPLACDYPAAAPHVGDYFSVADTVPTPAPGAGVYYVTSATYQGATRYGRQTMNHQTTGRNPALLPACIP